MRRLKPLMAFVIVGALAAGAVTELRAAPAPNNTAAFKAAASGILTNVRWRRWGGWGGWRPRIIIGGVALGAAVAAPYPYGYPYAPYGYGPYWGYPGYWGTRSSVCWDRGRRIPCPGSLP
jgi:hypothetical protein